MDITQQKKNLRHEMKHRKALLCAEDKLRKAEQIAAQLEQMPAFIKAKIIMVYWALPDEVPTQTAILRWMEMGKQIALPVVDGEHLVLREFSCPGDLCTDQLFGIGEPLSGREFQPHELDLIIVPGIAFDQRGGRMGRGKGYYDRLLSSAAAYKIGICFDCQLVDEVPLEPFDVLMDSVVWV